MRDAVDPWNHAVRSHARIGHAVEVHEVIGSTNDRARELLEEPFGPGRVVVAESQVAGRGRRGRTWLSPPGRNLTFSVAVRPNLSAAHAWQLSMAVALAAREACSRVVPVGLKWPNDLVAGDGLKVGGMLIETVIDGESLGGAVIGIGINANWRRAEMPADLSATATSLADLCGEPVDRVALLRDVLAALERELLAVESGETPIDRYREACDTIGSDVRVETPTGSLEGRAVDLDDTGALVVETASGRSTVTSGDVTSVRGMASV